MPGTDTIVRVTRRHALWACVAMAMTLAPVVGQLAAQFANAGAAAVSVLVDKRFAGTIDDLRAARAATDAPLLGKGFFSSKEHLRELRAAGADAVLLILRDLDDATTAHLLAYAQELGTDFGFSLLRRGTSENYRQRSVRILSPTQPVQPKVHVGVLAARTRKVSGPQMFRNQAKSARHFKGHFPK